MSINWQPSASREILVLRARVLQQIREFMAQRSILEVDTPVLDVAANTDPNIQPLMTELTLPCAPDRLSLYLQSSPEFAMKRLLAAGSGPIYQINKVFRNNESGKIHHPEFTMLEWYRPGFDYHELMDEVIALLDSLGTNMEGCSKVSYGDVFQKHTGIDPHTASLEDLQEQAKALGLSSDSGHRPLLLDFIFSRVVTQTLGLESPLFVYDYPACQAALAKLKPGQAFLAERFELFINGIEIANGFNELENSLQQKTRFTQENDLREQMGLPRINMSEELLAALAQGLPDCAGVAVGLDRLIMVLSGSSSIGDVLSFSPIKA